MYKNILPSTISACACLLLAFGLIVPGDAQAQLPPVIQSVATATGISGNATVNKPSNTASGDLLVASIALEVGSDATVTAPVGWILIHRRNNSSDIGLISFYKFAGASEPASYTFILTGQKWSAGIARISGVNSSNPINVVGSRVGETGNVIAPSVTTTTPNSLVLAIYTNKKGVTYVPSATTTEQFDVPNLPGGGPSLMMATFMQALTGATPNQTAVPQDTDYWVGLQIAISVNTAFPNHGVLSIDRLPEGQCELEFQGLAGLAYAVEYTDQLNPPNTSWTLLQNQTTDAAGKFLITDTTAAPMRFYRTVQP